MHNTKLQGVWAAKIAHFAILSYRRYQTARVEGNWTGPLVRVATLRWLGPYGGTTPSWVSTA